MLEYGNSIEDKSNAIKDLRNCLATLKWEIWESESMVFRDQVEEDTWEKYVSQRFKEWPYFNEEYIKELIFKPKNVVENSEVYEPIKKLIPNKKNAFLFG